MTQTVLLVHVNIYLVLTVHLQWLTVFQLHHPSSIEPFDGLCGLFSFQVSWNSFSPAIWLITVWQGLIDSDWILRTLSPSNESSKDLNLQRVIWIFSIPWWIALSVYHLLPSQSYQWKCQLLKLHTAPHIIVIAMCLGFVLICWPDRSHETRHAGEPTTACVPAGDDIAKTPVFWGRLSIYRAPETNYRAPTRGDCALHYT